jgi:predicted PurR-regulated permease PerM
MATEIGAALSNFSASLSKIVLSSFQSMVKNIPSMMFDVVILLFTFFFSLIGGENIQKYLYLMMPFSKKETEKFADRFDQVTYSIVYGHVFVGVIQGIIAGIGYYMLGVPNALLLTILTTLAGVLPVIGPSVVWLPVDIYFFMTGNVDMGILLLIYSLFVITPIDTILRPYVVSRKAEMNSALALIGMVGGTYAFGVTGFLLGPIFLASLILVIEIYRDNDGEGSIVLKESTPAPPQEIKK